tara:strand:- start:16 stop:333 length:318 start_codon:yes stop_codon:yes gene_type:complete
MPYFAKINNNIVTKVIVADQNFIDSGVLGDSSLWVQTSTSGSFRKNYAGTGFTYDSERDAFIAAKPFPSWLLVEDTCQWKAPVDKPTDDKMYTWDEDSTAWVEVE